MRKQRNYKQASIYYLVGNLFNKGILFITVPIYTRLLSTTDYGIATTYNSWISILSMIMGFALHMGIRNAYLDYKEDFDNFTSVTLAFTIVSSAIFSGVILAGALFFNIGSILILVILCLIQSFSAAVIQDYSYYLMMKYQYRFRTALMILPNLVSTIISVIVIMFILDTKLYMGRIVPMALVYFIFALFILIIAFHKGKKCFNKEYLKYGLTISAPLILHGIALNILSQSDRTMITMLADASQAGIYSLIYNFSMIATVITSALEGSWVPWFMEKLQERKIKEINTLVVDYVNLMTYAMVCLILVAPEVVKIMTTKSYWEGIKIIPPVVLANYIIFIYTLYVNVEHYYKRTVYITINTFIAASCNVILNFVFIPKFGYVGAAYTTLAAYFISFILHSRYAKKLEPEAYPLKIFIRPLLHILFASLIFYLFIEPGYIRWIIMICYLVGMLWREHNRIYEIFPGIKEKIIRKK